MDAFSSTQNKALLWDILQTSGKFNGLPTSSASFIQSAFEKTIQDLVHKCNISNSKPHLTVMNKEVISEMCNFILDIQLPKQDLFQKELKKKEDEMNSFLQLKIPKNIVFKDAIEEDKPIGDDIDKLLSQVLSTRERELELFHHNYPNPNPTIRASKTKHVTFQEPEFSEGSEGIKGVQELQALQELQELQELQDPDEELQELQELQDPDEELQALEDPDEELQALEDQEVQELQELQDQDLPIIVKLNYIINKLDKIEQLLYKMNIRFKN